eukprot:TRINITY_DN8229_c0_g1_i1.p2 TRINITY_DN8229_c0_g1~~TRINITY_DN8229_c0_g1_i1.p2  ORF type:complete len:169 (+),score=35.78 TRINITY_DN8229_c0_g1_i1:1001-1507(+)
MPLLVPLVSLSVVFLCFAAWSMIALEKCHLNSDVPLLLSTAGQLLLLVIFFVLAALRTHGTLTFSWRFVFVPVWIFLSVIHLGTIAYTISANRNQPFDCLRRSVLWTLPVIVMDAFAVVWCLNLEGIITVKYSILMIPIDVTLVTGIVIYARNSIHQNNRKRNARVVS